MTHWTVSLRYRLPEDRKGTFRVAEVGVESETAWEAIKAAVDALKEQVPTATVTGSSTNPTRS